MESNSSGEQRRGAGGEGGRGGGEGAGARRRRGGRGSGLVICPSNAGRAPHGTPHRRAPGPFVRTVGDGGGRCRPPLRLAGAGQVLVSDVVRVLLEPRRVFLMIPVVSRRLKGFTEPMLCYLVRAAEQDSSAGFLRARRGSSHPLHRARRRARSPSPRVRGGGRRRARPRSSWRARQVPGRRALLSEFSPRLISRVRGMLYARGVDAADVLATS